MLGLEASLEESQRRGFSSTSFFSAFPGTQISLGFKPEEGKIHPKIHAKGKDSLSDHFQIKAVRDYKMKQDLQKFTL